MHLSSARVHGWQTTKDMIMKNENYTVFVVKSSCKKVGPFDESCLIDTKSREIYHKAKLWAKENGYKVTREYLPDTELGAPDFVGAINFK